MLRKFKADLHIHTCLSPCADLDMSPRAIVDRAVELGINMIAITDHNSAENAGAVIRAARGTPLIVLPGMEVTSREEVHLLGLFDRVEDVLALQQAVYDHLPGENDERAFGMQVVVNEDSEVLSFCPRLLAGSTEFTTDQIVEEIRALDGIVVASHVDRETFGIIGQLGFIPEGLPLDALELSANTSAQEASRRFPEYAHWAFVRSSDAHYVHDIGKATTEFLLSEPCVQELKEAFRFRGGRRVVPAQQMAVDSSPARKQSAVGVPYGGPLPAYLGHC